MSENVKNTEMQNKTQSKGIKIVKAIFNTIINILIVLVLITSLLIAVMALTSKANGLSTIFGYTIQPIQSDSMKGGSPDGYPGGDYGKGDLIIGKSTGSNPDAVYEKGDIVTYKIADTDGKIQFISHRIVNTSNNDNNITLYQTWGDNRKNSEAPDQGTVEEYIPASDIVAINYSADYNGKVIKGLGNVLDYLRTQQGFFFVVLLPMIAFFLYELVRVVLNASSYRKAKDDEKKQAAVDAAVAEALSEKAGNAPSDNMTDEEREQFKQFLAFKKMQEQQAKEKADTPEDQPVKAAQEAVEKTAEKTDNTPEE